MKGFKNFLKVTKAEGMHEAWHTDCGVCKLVQAMLGIGGEAINMLLDHVGKVGEKDSFTNVIVKLKQGIMKQTNQCGASQTFYPDGTTMKVLFSGT